MIFGRKRRAQVSQDEILRSEFRELLKSDINKFQSEVYAEMYREIERIRLSISDFEAETDMHYKTLVETQRGEMQRCMEYSKELIDSYYQRILVALEIIASRK